MKGGSGGQGFPKYGGIGGKGGDIYVVSDSKSTLKKVKEKCPTKRYRAGGGGDSR